MSLSSKIAWSIITPSLFIITVFFALDYKDANDGFYALMFLLVIFLVLFSFHVGRYLSLSMQNIVKTASDLANGNLESRAKVHTIREINHLAETINSIAGQLQAHQQEKEKIPHVVTTKLNTLVQPLYETIDALEEKVKHRTFDMHKAKNASETLRIVLAAKEAEVSNLQAQLVASAKRKYKKSISQEA